MKNIVNDTAILSSNGMYTIFKYGDQIIRFRGPYTLEKYVEIKEWNHGYIVVMTKYSFTDELVEEYIDLIPTLRHLCYNPDKFLENIKYVKISYDEEEIFLQKDYSCNNMSMNNDRTAERIDKQTKYSQTKEDIWNDGYKNARLQDIKKLMDNWGINIEQAMKVFDLSEDDQLYYKEIVAQET